MQLTDIDPDDLGLVTAAAETANAVREVDSPWVHPWTVRGLQGVLRYGWDLEPGRHVAGTVDGRVVALGMVATSEWDNKDLAWLHVSVHPDVRRQGLGRRMFEHVCAIAAEDGRTKLGADAWDGSAGVPFLEGLGFEKKSQAINRRQHLAELSEERLQSLYDEAAAAATAYELVRIVGRTPEELVPALAETTAAINDAPLDDLDVEDEMFPPQRIRDYETATLSRGHRLYRLVARHRETGELAGHTVVAVFEEQPAMAHQHDTTVVRAHRGHRLGLLLKSGMNLWLREVEPQLETVDTWNAESNDHMIAVNEKLGYRWMGRELQFQRSL